MNDIFVVPLHNSNMPVLIDIEDKDKVMKLRWFRANEQGQVQATSHFTTDRRYKRRGLHNFILRSRYVDHKNSLRFDNRKCNLREATHLQNCCNQRTQIRPSKTSIYKGVSKKKSTGRYTAQIKQYGYGIYIGIFATEIEAAKAYDKKAVELFGEFARLNFPSQSPKT